MKNNKINLYSFRRLKKVKSLWLGIMIIFVCACTFDYGESENTERETPDLIMENVVYVRVRSADPIARFEAERSERYEKQGIMILKNFSFEQYSERGEEVSTFGRAGFASVDIESGDIFMDGGVRLEVESEDIILETTQLEWLDEPRLLSSGENDEVYVFQQNGTNFVGIGLKADVRWRTWEFIGNVNGIFISDEENEEEPSTTEVVSRRETEDRREQETRREADDEEFNEEIK